MSKNISVNLYSYDNILLLTYLEIANTQNLQLLIISGVPTQETLMKQWESILTKNAEYTNNLSFASYLNNLKSYGKLIADYEMIKLSLMKLVMVVDNDEIAYLKSKGYAISTATASGYAASIDAALKRSNSILTRIKMKQNEMFSKVQEAKAPTPIEESLANISAVLGFDIGTDITLAKFNAYNKIAKRKIDAQKEKHKNKKA